MKDTDKERWRDSWGLGIVCVCVTVSLCATMCVFALRDSTSLGTRSCHRDHNQLSCTQQKLEKHQCWTEKKKGH